MNKIFYLIILVFLSHFCIAQKEANMWYFGNMAAINFNSGSPVPFSGSAMYILEGCSSIADTNGNALFYTNGLKVWNKNNVQMPNGFGLLGDDNAAQSALIVRAPGSYTLFYIFTSPTNGNLPMHYSVVDMTQQGGLGDVTTKNVFLFNNSTEKVTAVHHKNGTDIWVIGHQYANNKFYSFLVTAAGVNTTPVITSVGTVHLGSLGFAGYMKTSHNGSKIAYAITISQDLVELLDFDNSTGIPSNPITFNNIDEAYGLEFSPDDSKLYATEENPQMIEQWDLSSGNAATIMASQTTVGTGTGSGFAALQLAPDGKIYLAKRSYITSLGAINNPNAAGLACNFVDVAVTLVGGSSMYGLPNFMQSLFATASVVPPVASFQTNDTSFCQGNCITFTNLSTNATSYQWSFPGAIPLTSTDKNPQSVCYLDSGNYNVTLVAANSGGTDTFTLSSYIKVAASPPTPIISQSNDTLFCSIDSSYTSYQWYNDTTLVPGATNPIYVAPNTGNYNVSVTNASRCSIAVGINIILGIPSWNNQSAFIISPNPASDELVLKGNMKIENCMVDIFNTLGQKLLSMPLKDSRGGASVNIKDLASGLYFVKLQSNEEKWVGRFVKQ